MRVIDRFRVIVKAPAFVLALLALPISAHAADFTIKQEPGASIPMTEPQTNEYGVGGTNQIKALFPITSYLDVGPTGSFMFLPADKRLVESGVAWGFGGGVRLQRPRDNQSYRGIRPWIDADLLYVRTGKLDRPAFDAAVGFAVPLGKTHAYSVGPFVRYLQVVQTPERSGYDNRHAKIVTLGLSFELGSGVRKAARGRRPLASCPDYDQDNDGIADAIDRCVMVAGPMDNGGCPAYKKLVVKEDKLELKERLYFAWNEATLQDVSFPVLDEVVQALKDNKNFRVQVEGHTSSEGGEEHNQTLSEARASAVLDYLVAHGIGKERLVSKGFASTVPVDTNTTSEGRENNRRVEFVVNFILLTDRSM